MLKLTGKFGTEIEVLGDIRHYVAIVINEDGGDIASINLYPQQALELAEVLKKKAEQVAYVRSERS